VSGGQFNSSYKFDDILDLAHQIINEVKANPPEPDNTFDHGFVRSFWDNTIGDAYSYSVLILCIALADFKFFPVCLGIII
jgi:hypothetical protein